MLHFVLHVPKLVCSLLSVSKISKDANCRVVFCESHCTFQDQDSRETIGPGKMIGGLYYFDKVSGSHKIAQGLSSVHSSSVKEIVMLWHRRLGHPNFFYLKYLFPILLKILIVQFFNVKVVFLLSIINPHICPNLSSLPHLFT